MIRIPYGISNFEVMVEEGYLYIDRTQYIERLEQSSLRYLFFLRPRRFGKSLWISTLEHYYGLQYKEKFNTLFGKYYIGQHPTKSVNKYLILKFDFSQMDTGSYEKTYTSFLNNVKDSAIDFLREYPQFFTEEEVTNITPIEFPAEVFRYVHRLARFKAKGHKVYLLIDEYDHFANELLSFHFEEFTKIVGQNGFVRKFYEAIKVGTHSGVIDRIFVTGISPLTLDSFTSGFNISSNVSSRKQYSELLGFTEEEVREILIQIDIPSEELDATLATLRKWYNGYRFNKEMKNRMYNPDMVLYFANAYVENGSYPETLLDPNIASDYTKIRRLFKIKGKESEHLKYLEELLQTGQLRSRLVHLFEIDWRFDRKDFISLLYYTGILTIAGSELISLVLKMPNYVIEALYYQYFHQMLLERSQLKIETIDVEEKVTSLALENDMQPLITYTQQILTELSNRDKMKFDERYIKLIFTSIFFNVGIYTIHHEFEVKKSSTSKGYVDILLLQRPPFQTTYQFIFELKYVKKQDADKAAAIQQAAVEQLQDYLQYDAYLQGLENLKAYVVVFVGNEGRFVELS